MNAHDSGIEIETDVEHDIFFHVDFADARRVLLPLTNPQLRLVVDRSALWIGKAIEKMESGHTSGGSSCQQARLVT